MLKERNKRGWRKKGGEKGNRKLRKQENCFYSGKEAVPKMKMFSKKK